ELYGSHGMAAHEYPAMLARVAAGELDPAALVGRTVPLDGGPAALADVAAATHPRMTVLVP
ncbi:MAG TPA: alcohol dehydrogenase, partial [Actinotalea sp.]|nr:alcohol dehydrogenase [Actinotalea sp.]